MSADLPDDGNRDRDTLAGEYALGVLDADERAAVQARLQDDAALRRAVDAWQRRLAPLTEDIAPIEPPPDLAARVWRRIDAALTERHGPARPTVIERPGLWQRIEIWRWATAAALLAAVVFLILDVGLLQPRLGTGGYVAVLNDTQAKPAWLIEASHDGRKLTVDPLEEDALTAAASGHAFELWLLPAGGGAPISLGLIDPANTRKLALPADLAGKLAHAAALAVSLEPPGGSKTGAPTGPVLHSGAVINRAG